MAWFQDFQIRPLTRRVDGSSHHSDFPEFHLEDVCWTILCPLGELPNGSHRNAEFLFANPGDQGLEGFVRLESSRRQAPDSRKFVIVVRTADGKNAIPVSNQDCNGALGRFLHYWEN